MNGLLGGITGSKSDSLRIVVAAAAESIVMLLKSWKPTIGRRRPRLEITADGSQHSHVLHLEKDTEYSDSLSILTMILRAGTYKG